MCFLPDLQQTFAATHNPWDPPLSHIFYHWGNIFSTPPMGRTALAALARVATRFQPQILSRFVRCFCPSPGICIQNRFCDIIFYFFQKIFNFPKLPYFPGPALAQRPGLALGQSGGLLYWKLPSFICRTVSASSATAGSWVTMMTVQPSVWARSLRMATMLALWKAKGLEILNKIIIIHMDYFKLKQEIWHRCPKRDCQAAIPLWIIGLFSPGGTISAPPGRELWWRGSQESLPAAPEGRRG